MHDDRKENWYVEAPLVTGLLFFFRNKIIKRTIDVPALGL
jgi:hypothetical protein